MSFGSTLSGCCTRSESALASQVLHHSVTTWLINFDGPHGHVRCFKPKSQERQRLHGLYGAERRLLGGPC